MDFENIDFEQITYRAGGAVGAIFLISIADKELGKMNTKEATPLFEYRHYAYAIVGAILPSLMAPTKNKEDFSTKYAPAINAFSDAMLFFGASQILEKQIPDMVQINGVSENYANYVLGADANVDYAMQNYVTGCLPATDDATILVERETGDQVYINPDTGDFVKPILEQPAYLDISRESPQDPFTMVCP